MNEDGEASGDTAVWPPPRAAHAAAFVPGVPGVDGNEEEGVEAVAGVPRRMVVVGGNDADGSPCSDVWVYNIDDGMWTSLEVRLPLGMQAVVCSRYTLANGVGAQTTGTGPGAIAHHTATYFPATNQVLVFGGYDHAHCFQARITLTPCTAVWLTVLLVPRLC